MHSLVALSTAWMDRPSVLAANGRVEQWMDPLFRRFIDWITSESMRELAGNAALFLIVGGTAILVLIVCLVLLQSIFPERARQRVLTDAEKAERQLRPTLLRRTSEALAVTSGPRGDADDGQRIARSLPIRNVDGALDYALAKGLGEPRILRHQPNFTILRFYNCRGCLAAEGEPTVDATGHLGRCGFETGFLQGAFQNLYAKGVTVRETACHRRGNASCEYEVWH